MAETFPFEERRTGVLNPDMLVRREPVGVVGAIAPWNVPLFIAVMMGLFTAACPPCLVGLG